MRGRNEQPTLIELLLELRVFKKLLNIYGSGIIIRVPRNAHEVTVCRAFEHGYSIQIRVEPSGRGVVVV